MNDDKKMPKPKLRPAVPPGPKPDPRQPLCTCGVRGCPQYNQHRTSLGGPTGARSWGW